MATAVDRQHYALQTIFSFFLGLMVLAVVGVGVNTFYPSPDEKYNTQIQQLYRDQEAFNLKSSGGASLSAEDQAKVQAIQRQIDDLTNKQQAEMKDWARGTSIILVLFATLVMGVSLVRSEQLRVISNGLLLGGLFTMVYGSGWTIFSGNSVTRFIVIVFALVVTLGLGYAKFVYGRKLAREDAITVASSAGVGAAGPSDVFDGLAGRVTQLEERLNAVAAALGTSNLGREKHPE
ncbi:MAG: hypothetical protein HGA39_07340 [Coriobacteriia bacterium]|nr:hypothetical protein [Coriobacteriia bacterium]